MRAPLRVVDRVAYPLWAAAITIASARSFYGYMLEQTGGAWSAPLDDVFIHFDYARSTALGHPFEWTVGNGYSSGNTSLTYPFVLALGWLLGFTGRRLIVWAGIVAATCVFGVLLAARRIFVEGPRDDWGRLSSYLLPPVVLGVGALDWSLWSGMEVSFFLATWAIAFALYVRGSRGWLLGLAGVLMVTTRPEAALTIAIFGIAAALAARTSRLGKIAILARVGTLPALALAIQAFANKALTGEYSANGAIVKLALNNPYMTAAEKWDDYAANVKYAALRNLDYHFADIAGDHMSDVHWDNPVWTYLAKTAWWAGVVPLALAVLPLCFRRTRAIAWVVWAQIVAWIVLVSVNGQVRWQNERYVMPAVAWMLVMTALGVSVALRARARAGGRDAKSGLGLALHPSAPATLVVFALVVQVIGVLTRPPGPPHFRLSWALAFAGGALAMLVLWRREARAALVVVLVLFAYDHQLPKMRDQKWFYGRASRNIRDQHLAIGAFLRELKPHRVLVGDAGAILYESDLPGLDIIGLGGFRGLPFARAGINGLPSTLELLERVPDADRPDVLAIFPTWWGVLPAWFASDEIRRFPVEGNVICGGYEQNVYRADWHLLNTGDRIRAMPFGDTRLRQEIDVADLVSERENGYAFDRPANGWTDMRVLPDPGDASRDLFDAGRRIAVGRSERFVMRGVAPGAAAHLVVRAAPESSTRVTVLVGGVHVASIDLERTGGWVEASVAIPRAVVADGAEVRLVVDGPGDLVDFHEWVTQ